MKAMLINGGGTLHYDADALGGQVKASAVLRCHALKSDRPLVMRYGANFVYKLASTLLLLGNAKVRHDEHPGSVLLAYDMPILVPYWRQEQRYVPPEIACELGADGMGAETWRVCQEMVRAEYASADFDYVFVYPDGPDMATLIDNGLTKDGGNVVSVASRNDILKILSAEGF